MARNVPLRRRRPPLDPQVARTLAALGLTRRGFLRNVGTGGVLLGGGTLLSACGISGGSDSQESEGASAGGTELGGELNFSNWPLYIDTSEEDETDHPSLTQFTEETGVTVNYFEDINSNEEYFAQIREQLDAGEDIGRDLIVLTDWMAGRLVSFGWLSELNVENIPNAGNLVPRLQEVAFDPDRSYSLPWQSGLTGIGVNPAALGREVTSINDLLDAEDLNGRVTFLTEMRDTMGLVMSAMDIDPLNHEFSDYERAIERLQQAVDRGQIRQFTGNEYATDLAAGNIAACIAWSGDVLQLQFDDPDIQFVVPDEGATLWSDNMLIPANAANQPAAEALMNFVYQPEVAAQIAAWVNYITPVDGAQEAMAEIDEELAESELIFPSEETFDQTFEFKQLDEDEETEYQNLFQSVIGA
jgi:spermidine/putrescine transport system substrate-binding protein